jgi:hypothetical protein
MRWWTWAAAFGGCAAVDAIIKAEGREFIFVLGEEASGAKESHDDGDKHEEAEGKEYHFQRIEVKTGHFATRLCAGDAAAALGSGTKHRGQRGLLPAIAPDEIGRRRGA